MTRISDGATKRRSDESWHVGSASADADARRAASAQAAPAEIAACTGRCSFFARTPHGLVAHVTGVVLGLLAVPAYAQRDSLTDTAVHWPTAAEVLRVLTLQDYNTRVVVLGTALLGLAAGMIGTFMLLRKRALLGDALSHATLPGIAIAFIVMARMGGTGKWLPGLLLGAAISGVLGVLTILVIRHYTRLKEDAALGIVLSVFFGVGIAILGMVQEMTEGSAAGLESFIYGKTASMLRSDAIVIGVTAVAVAGICAMLFKELGLLCFDQGYARTQGWPTLGLDLVLMALVTAVTVIGLQAVGLILIIALLIIPAAAARFWTERLVSMFVISAVVGAVSGMVGAALSALIPRLPAGAIIVVAASVVFLISMFFGTRRGILVRWRDRVELNRRVAQQHLLRAMYELAEEGGDGQVLSLRSVMQKRSWTWRELRKLVAQAQDEGLVIPMPNDQVRLTERGMAEATRMTRNHRLWEIYLITHADIAPSHVDRDADAIEHVLGQEMVRKLETILEKQEREERVAVPVSPHPIG